MLFTQIESILTRVANHGQLILNGGGNAVNNTQLFARFPSFRTCLSRSQDILAAIVTEGIQLVVLLVQHGQDTLGNVERGESARLIAICVELGVANNKTLVIGWRLENMGEVRQLGSILKFLDKCNLKLCMVCTTCIVDRNTLIDNNRIESGTGFAQVNTAEPVNP